MPHILKYKTILNKTENELNQLQMEVDDGLLLSEKSISICLKKLAELRTSVVTKGFIDETSEIIFLKEIKHRLVAHLIYHNSVYKIETNRPNGSSKIKRKYIQAELNKLRNYFYENLHLS